MKKYLFLLIGLVPSFLTAQPPKQIKFCIELNYEEPKRRNDTSFDYTTNFLLDLLNRNIIGIEEAAMMLQLLVFMAINDSPYDKSVSIEIDGNKRNIPFSHELFFQLLALQKEADFESPSSEKRQKASSSFLQEYTDIE